MKRLIMASITAVVVIVVMAGTLIPILDDATTTEKTFTNSGLWRMKAIGDGDDWTYNGTNWYYEEEILSDVSLGGSNALLGPDWCVRTNGQARGATISGNATSITATSDGLYVTFTGTGGEAVQDLPGYGLDSQGDYIMTSAGAEYMLGNSIIFGTGQSAVDGVGVVIHVEGTIDDGATFTMYTNSGGVAVSDAVFSNVKINCESIDGYKDLYSFESVTADVTFNATVDDVVTAHTGSVTYNRVVVPYEVTAEKSVHFTDGENAILNAIPVMIIVALLLAIVAMVIRSRMD